MAALDWVMDPGEIETEGEETMAEIAARLLGQTTSHTGFDVGEEETQDPNNVEPQSVPLTEAKNSVSTLLQFVGRVCNRLSGYSGYSDIRKNLSVRIVV